MFESQSSLRTSELPWQLPAEAITVRIRWFGLCVGYVFVNLLASSTNQVHLNAILALGAVYAVLDTFYGVRGKAFLIGAPLFISVMEAAFITMLCWFDEGLDSHFRFYYFLSLLVCAIRYSPRVTYLTFIMHSLSYAVLAMYHSDRTQQSLITYSLMVVFMGWATWASTALTGLLKDASHRLSELNQQLQKNQTELEERIAHRTRQLQESQALLVQQESRLRSVCWLQGSLTKSEIRWLPSVQSSS